MLERMGICRRAAVWRKLHFRGWASANRLWIWLWWQPILLQECAQLRFVESRLHDHHDYINDDDTGLLWVRLDHTEGWNRVGAGCQRVR